MSNFSVMIAIPCGSGFFHWQHVHSLLNTNVELQTRGISFEVKILPECSIIEQARNVLANEFINSPHSHLFMIDSDIQWTPDQFMEILRLGVDLPIVCASYPEKNDSLTFHIQKNGTQLDERGCIEIRGAGLGFTIVQRKVMIDLAQGSEKVMIKSEPLQRIFRCDVKDGEFQGEDMRFFSDCRKLGYKVYLKPSVTLGHIGTKNYSKSLI